MDRATDRHPHGRRYAALAVLGTALVATQALGSWRDSHAVLINTSASLANWAFFVDKRRQPIRGEIAFFKAPQSGIVTRHFGPDAPPFGKIVYGIGGDEVTRSGSIVSINGSPTVKLKRVTKLGETLQPGPTGIIPRGCYFMATPHRDGLDSRYAAIGFVCARQIIGTGRAIL